MLAGRVRVRARNAFFGVRFSRDRPSARQPIASCTRACGPHARVLLNGEKKIGCRESQEKKRAARYLGSRARVMISEKSLVS